MTVQELIEALKEFDPELKVQTRDYFGDFEDVTVYDFDNFSSDTHLRIG